MEMGICTLLRSSKGGRDNKKKTKYVKKILKLDMFQLFLNNIHEYCDAPRP
jgi:hypothetical protein